jgi:hypothetical protein
MGLDSIPNKVLDILYSDICLAVLKKDTALQGKSFRDRLIYPGILWLLYIWQSFKRACILYNKQSPWPESVSEPYRPSDRRLSPKLVPIFADRGCHVVSVADPYGRSLGFLDRSCYFLFQVAPQLYQRGWVDPLLFRKSGSAGNGTRTSRAVARNSMQRYVSVQRPNKQADKHTAFFTC